MSQPTTYRGRRRRHIANRRVVPAVAQDTDCASRISEVASLADNSESSGLSLIVDEVRPQCDDVVTLTLVHSAGQSLPTWEPGAHIDLHLANGMVRQYSLHSPPDDCSRYQVSVLLEANSRGGSTFVHECVSKGVVVEASVPRNNFDLVPAAEYLFVAGGIGITPLLQMVATVQHRGLPYRLAYAARSRSRVAFAEELRDNPNVSIHISAEGNSLDVSCLITEDLDPRVHIYCCGPRRLLDAVTDRCRDLGISKQLHVEHFSGNATGPDPTIDSPFDVELSRTGVVLRVESDRTILDAVLAAGIKAPNSCGEGVCGSCEVRILEGEVDHRDQVLDDDEKAENEVIMICCSRARSPRLVLDM